MTRPSGDFLTGLGVMLITATICACAIIVTLHSPTVATFGGLFGAGSMGIWFRLVAPHPSSVPAPVVVAPHPIEPPSAAPQIPVLTAAETALRGKERS